MSDSPAAPAAPAPSGAAPGSHQESSKAAQNDVLNTVADTHGNVSGQEDEIEDTGEDLPAEVVKEVAKLKRKLKVGGKDIEVDEDELVRRAQMGYSADEKWQEASKMRKQMEGFLSLLQNDPEAALEKLGLDVDDISEKRIQRRIEEMKKSPEQVEREKIEKELKQLKAEREKEKEDHRSREMKQLQDKYAVEIETEINSALDNNDFGLPKSPYTVKRMADVLIYALKNKIPNFTAKKALEVVQAEIREELNQMYASTPDEVFEKLVGKSRLNSYRKGKINKKKAAPSAGDVRATGIKELQSREDSKPQEKVHARNFFKQLGKK